MPNSHIHDQSIGRVNAILEEHSSFDLFLSRGLVEEESDPEEAIDYEDELQELEF